MLEGRVRSDRSKLRRGGSHDVRVFERNVEDCVASAAVDIDADEGSGGGDDDVRSGRDCTGGWVALPAPPAGTGADSHVSPAEAVKGLASSSAKGLATVAGLLVACRGRRRRRLAQAERSRRRRRHSVREVGPLAGQRRRTRAWPRRRQRRHRH